jgi:hypothetical protein
MDFVTLKWFFVFVFIFGLIEMKMGSYSENQGSYTKKILTDFPLIYIAQIFFFAIII